MPDLQEFVTKRLEGYRDRTAMWGSHEAVELQAMQLLEIEAFMAGIDQVNPRIVLETFVKCLQRLQKLPYVFDVPLPLHQWEPGTKFGEALFTLCQKVRTKLGLAKEL